MPITTIVVALKTANMNRLLLFFVIASIIISCDEPHKYDFVIENVTLFDGHEDRGTVNVTINNDTIAAITTNKLEADSIIDGFGKFMIPGLVNAHVHASSLEDLKAGYPLGILTLLNMHTGLEERELEWKEFTKTLLAFPRFMALDMRPQYQVATQINLVQIWKLYQILCPLQIGYNIAWIKRLTLLK